MGSVKMRQEVERKIADKVIESILAQGLLIQVTDGEEECTGRISDPEAIKKAMYSTDENILWVYSDETVRYAIGFVHFIYGNDGHDVIHDYSINLEEIMKPANDLADSYF